MEKAAIRVFHKNLHRWYAAHGRKDLPWRNTKDPYAIYLSEVMLQQTQVKTVRERYYHPFLTRFPTLSALAKAPEQDVMKAWEGLGYYNRARHLHQTAKASNGKLPRDVEALIALPGIGKNTAHAVASFAFGQALPVMEANVKRVLCRIFAIRLPTPDILWEKATLLLDHKNTYDYNQAMMDIGATICTKRNPACSLCPANSICEGQKNPELYPSAVAKKSVPVRKRWIIVPINTADELYLQKRTSRFLTGLYGFPEFEAGQSGTFLKKDIKKLGSVTQQYSHFTLEADVFLVKSKEKGKGWYPKEKALRLPLSRADLKVMALL